MCHSHLLNGTRAFTNHPIAAQSTSGSGSHAFQQIPYCRCGCSNSDVHDCLHRHIGCNHGGIGRRNRRQCRRHSRFCCSQRCDYRCQRCCQSRRRSDWQRYSISPDPGRTSDHGSAPPARLCAVVRPIARYEDSYRSAQQSSPPQQTPYRTGLQDRRLLPL